MMTQTLTAIQNPYWDEAAPFLIPQPGTGSFELIEFQQAQYLHRRHFVTRYAWAIPDPDSVLFVAQHLGDRAIEIGAGTGYWAWVLSQSGTDIIAFDAAPPDRELNGFFGAYDEHLNFKPSLIKTWHPVSSGTPETLLDHADRSLFLCWPPYASDMAYRCLQNYRGPRLVYIGEEAHGCTGDDAFFEELEKHWELIASHDIVQWRGSQDEITVYDRKARENDANQRSH